jgi:hypothetical protein
MAFMLRAFFCLIVLVAANGLRAESIEEAALPIWEKYLILRDGPDAKADEWWTITEMEMEVSNKKMAVEPVPGGNISVTRVLPAKSFIAFVNQDNIFIDRGNGVFPLTETVELPPDIGQFTAAYAEGDKLFLGVKKLDTAAPYGLLIVDIVKKTSTHIPAFQVQVAGVAEGLREMSAPLITSMAYRSGMFGGKGQLFAGAKGGVAEIDIRKERLQFIISDPEKERIERPWLTLIDDDLWWLIRNSDSNLTALNQLRKGGGGSSYQLLNDIYLNVHGVAQFGRRIVAATYAGLVEIDNKARQYVHYPTANISNRLEITHVAVNGGKLWASHGSNLIRYDLPRRKAIIHAPVSPELVPPITSFGWFRDRLYLGTTKGIFEVLSFE